MKIFISTLILIILTCLISCSGPYTYDDSGKTSNLTENEPFEIVLEGEADSKFAWELDSKPSSVQFIEPVVKTKKGEIETYTFNFKTESDGEELIRIIYTDGIDIKRTFELTIIVGEFGLIESR